MGAVGALLVSTALVACSAPADTSATVTDEDFRDATAVGPMAGFDTEAFDAVGQGLCDDIRENGDGAYFGAVDALEADGVTEDAAIRAVSALVVRYCPDLAAD